MHNRFTFIKTYGCINKISVSKYIDKEARVKLLALTTDGKKLGQIIFEDESQFAEFLSSVTLCDDWFYNKPRCLNDIIRAII